MSRTSTTKGKVFERRIAALIRDTFPGIDARRSSQADRAVQSDVYTIGHVTLDRIWWELTDACKPDPRKKLEQAERDLESLWPIVGSADRLPVVVWHRIGERTTHVTMRLRTLVELARCGDYVGDSAALVTLDVVEFLALLSGGGG